MAKIFQHITATATLPSVTWRQDIILDPPVLNFPLDEVRFCPEVLQLYGESVDVVLSWNGVSGATFYVLQIADNSSFSGPSLLGIKTSATSVTLNYYEHIRIGEKIYWRVSAHNTTGGVSVMSEPRTMTIECPDQLGIDYDPETDNYAAASSPQICDKASVALELVGSNTVRRVDIDRVWALNINYDCKAFEGSAVAISAVSWEIKQQGSAVTIDEQVDGYIKLDVKLPTGDLEEQFEIIAHVYFTITGGGTFLCSTSKKVLIEGVLSAGGGNDHIGFVIQDPDCENNLAVVLITEQSCSFLGDEEVGDEVTVHDTMRCFFDLPDETLIGLSGQAIRMKDTEDDLDPYNDCFWKVISLCTGPACCGD